MRKSAISPGLADILVFCGPVWCILTATIIMVTLIDLSLQLETWLMILTRRKASMKRCLWVKNSADASYIPCRTHYFGLLRRMKFGPDHTVMLFTKTVTFLKTRWSLMLAAVLAYSACTLSVSFPSHVLLRLIMILVGLLSVQGPDMWLE
jgi:hypothetical protein